MCSSGLTNRSSKYRSDEYFEIVCDVRGFTDIVMYYLISVKRFPTITIAERKLDQDSDIQVILL